MNRCGIHQSLQKKSIFQLITVLILLIVLPVISCTSSVPQELIENEKLWKDQGLLNYDFILERQCFCPEEWRGPISIHVRDKTSVSITYVSGGKDVTGDKFENVNTIDKLFAMLKDAYAGKGDFDQRAENINVSFDSKMGYPTYIFLDVSQMIADEEQGYTVTNLTKR